MRKEITSLKNQVEYYKGAQDALRNFIEYVLEEEKISEKQEKVS
jgi:hypothetical protein